MTEHVALTAAVASGVAHSVTTPRKSVPLTLPPLFHFCLMLGTPGQNSAMFIPSSLRLSFWNESSQMVWQCWCFPGKLEGLYVCQLWYSSSPGLCILENYESNTSCWSLENMELMSKTVFFLCYCCWANTIFNHQKCLWYPNAPMTIFILLSGWFIVVWSSETDS